tara:strand:- start:1737 stop:2759 length:1023 start_codon:yes stop_codon:yes gene_type:complete
MAEQKINVEELEPKKEKEVELDLSDAKEKDVEVKQEETKEEPKLNVGEVDLGYTDHESKQEEKSKVVVEEVKTEEQAPKEEKKPVNLKKKKDDYQSRINQLTGKMRESQRREKAALDYAKGLQKKFDVSKKQFDQTTEAYLKEIDAKVDAQRTQVKAALKTAMEKQDIDSMTEANDKLTQLAVEKEKARLELANREKLKEEEKSQDKQEDAIQSAAPNTAPQLSPKAKKWAEENPWFGDDKVMTDAATTIHHNVVTEGIEPDSDQYYNEVNTRLKSYFPSKFESEDEPVKEQRKPVQTVASAGRKQEGRRTVRLTASQVAIAKKLNVPLDEYAKYVKEDK